MEYQEFLETKKKTFTESGFDIEELELNPMLFPFQKYCVKVALFKAKLALFEDCGLGKSIQQLEWSKHVSIHTQKPVIILCPLNVVDQTKEEAVKFNIDLECFDITNFAQLQNLDVSKYGGVVIDECFAPNTKIQVLRKNKLHEVDIKDCLIGDKVLNCTGIDTIKSIKTKKIPYAIKIKYNGKEIISSPRHPYFTQRGWVSAKEIKENDFIVSTDKAMRILRGELSSNNLQPIEEKILQSILLSEMEDETARIFSESSQSRSSEEKRTIESEILENGKRIDRSGQNQKIKPYAEFGDQTKSFGYFESNESQTFSAWGEWSRDDITTAINEGCTVRQLDSGICYIFGKITKGLPYKLQSRFSALRSENCDRSGWELTLFEKALRQKEGRETGFFGVESFEVLEQGDNRLDKFRNETGELYFYDLEISKHPSFTINECLVHNSSILKGKDRKTASLLIEKFKGFAYKLCCSATPSPNDHMELGQHVEFLEYDTYENMKSMFFVQDQKIKTNDKWRLRKHAEDDFWKYVASWSIAIDNPKTLGFDGEGYDLPELEYVEHIIEVENKTDNLFGDIAISSTDLHRDLKRSREGRINKALELVNSNDKQWIIWVLGSEEANDIHKLIPGSVNVHGGIKPEEKSKYLLGFGKNEFRVLITKTSIASMGLNYQNCSNMIFMSYDHKFEPFYQGVRRIFRFGQLFKCWVHLLVPESQKSVRATIIKKQNKHFEKIKQMAKYTADTDYKQNTDIEEVKEKEVKSDKFWLINGDAIEETKKIETESVDYSFFSPPFKDLYTYSDDPRDLSNVKNDDDFYDHFKFLVPELFRVLKPGRLLSMHIMQGTTSIGKNGYLSIVDFRGQLISLFQSFGFYFHAEKMIRKSPQLAAVRTKNVQLMHGQTKRDSSINRPGLADYIITFRKPGKNQVPIKNEIEFEKWCNIAEPYEFDSSMNIDLMRKVWEPLWLDIEEGDVMRNFRTAKGVNDEKHMTPTQLTVIRNCYLLWSNPGDTCFSPFGGIGSEGCQALEMDRKSINIELKKSYFNLNVHNHRQFELKKNSTLTLF